MVSGHLVHLHLPVRHKHHGGKAGQWQSAQFTGAGKQSRGTEPGVRSQGTDVIGKVTPP